MPKAHVNNITINYQRAGSGPNIVLIHGLGANLAFWYLTIFPKLAKNFNVTIYDLRGHGKSEMPLSGYTTAEMACDLCSLLDDLSIRRAHIVGHSFGASVALHFAVLFPYRVISLTLADGRIRAIQPAQKLKDWPFWNRWKSALNDLGMLFGDEEELDFDLLESFAHRQLHGKKPLLLEDAPFIPFHEWGSGVRVRKMWLRLLNTTSARQDFKSLAGLTLDALRRVHHPTLAVYGEYSFCLPSCRGLSDRLPSCDVKIVPKVGHYHPMIKPRFFLHSLTKFVLSHD